MPDGTEFMPIDPGIFCDDDGRIFLYAYASRPLNGIRNGCSQIVGYELDSDNPCHVLRGPIVLLEMNPEAHVWERFGSCNQNPYFGWIEGPHLLKHHNRYYLIYATPNTQYKNYAMAVAFSDDGPLGKFFYQKKNGLIKGYIVAILVRGLFHTIGGYLYWMDYMPDNFPKSLAAIYPIVYNYSYILAEAVITLIVISLPPVKKALARVRMMAQE